MATKDTDNLERIKKNIEQAYEYFLPNYERFHTVRNFVFNTTISEKDIETLETLQKPVIETNIVEAYLNRLLGNFMKQMPSFHVSNKDNVMTPVDPQIIEILQGNLNYILREANQKDFEYQTYEDILSGGFTAIKIYTDFEDEKSFDQVIKWERAFDPTLCGWDPLAKHPNKIDGKYCFELYPQRLTEFKEEFPDQIYSKNIFANQNAGFNWFYISQSEEIVMRCYYYEKKIKRKKLIQLANKKILFKDQLATYLENWRNTTLMQEPIIVQERMTDVSIIVRYDLVGNEILEYKELDYSTLPILFAGREQNIKKNPKGAVQSMTKPYLYHAIDAQRLMNFSAQTLGNNLENMVMHKFKAPLEGIPVQDEYAEAYTNIQKSSVLVYNQFKDSDPTMRLDQPEVIPLVPSPPEVMGTFSGMPTIIQNILGSHDAITNEDANKLSGEAIIQGATQSDVVAKPYNKAFLSALQTIGQIYIDMFPRYYIYARNLPILDKNGQKQIVKINTEDGINIKYDAGTLNVKVDAGLNSDIQRARSLQMMGYLSQTFPNFGALVQSQGLNVILDNCDFNGVDMLKEAAPKFMQQMQQQQAMAMQMNPVLQKNQIEQTKLQQKAQSDSVDAMLRQKQMDLEQQDITNDTIKILMDANIAHDDASVQMAKANVEREVHNDKLDMEAHKHALNIQKTTHEHILDLHNLENAHPSTPKIID